MECFTLFKGYHSERGNICREMLSRIHTLFKWAALQLPDTQTFKARGSTWCFINCMHIGKLSIAHICKYKWQFRISFKIKHSKIWIFSTKLTSGTGHGVPEGCFPVPCILCPCMLGRICSMPCSILYHPQILFKMKSIFFVISSAKLVRGGVLACSQGFAVKSVRWDDAHRQMGNEEGQWSCAKCCTRMRNHRIPGWFVLEGTLKLTYFQCPAMGRDTLHQTSHFCELYSGLGPFTNRC